MSSLKPTSQPATEYMHWEAPSYSFILVASWKMSQVWYEILEKAYELVLAAQIDKLK